MSGNLFLCWCCVTRPLIGFYCISKDGISLAAVGDRCPVLLQHTAAAVRLPFMSGRQQSDAPLARLPQAKQTQRSEPLVIHHVLQSPEHPLSLCWTSSRLWTPLWRWGTHRQHSSPAARCSLASAGLVGTAALSVTAKQLGTQPGCNTLNTPVIRSLWSRTPPGPSCRASPSLSAPSPCC